MTTTANRITKRLDRCGGSACIRDTRIAVWGIEQWRRLGKSDAWLLDNFPGLSIEDLLAAWEYAGSHPDEMDEAIRRNAEA